ncbi:hypothetical protein PHJA_000098800 [Phtheirospermum japonicum]|uniref:Uncharacterized protein n=1 Tax=Phtheirospermum japonicum TaxID=374723 RepID=A0A830B4L1_9LAMI|nr:hypothetical protein PHJA_000098800 [Phtheirospermum japonicum]
MDLLKGLFLSGTPLTDIILKEGHVDRPVKQKTESGILLHKIEKESSSDKSKKMILKVVVKKSTNKLLFAQEEDFVDSLFSLLTIPLGGVECLLGSKTCLKNIDNLYRSLASINGDKYLKTKVTKDMLLKPSLYKYYISEKQILPLIGKHSSKIGHETI